MLLLLQMDDCKRVLLKHKLQDVSSRCSSEKSVVLLEVWDTVELLLLLGFKFRDYCH